MPDTERPDPPPRCDRDERLKDETAAGQLRVGDGKPARAEVSAAPQHEIKVEHARSPAATGAATELTLNAFQAREHFRRLEAALH